MNITVNVHTPSRRQGGAEAADEPCRRWHVGCVCLRARGAEGRTARGIGSVGWELGAAAAAVCARADDPQIASWSLAAHTGLRAKVKDRARASRWSCWIRWAGRHTKPRYLVAFHIHRVI
jgi:hypothetical protein